MGRILFEIGKFLTMVIISEIFDKFSKNDKR